MREAAVIIEGTAPLVGVVASPDASPGAADSPVFLLLSAGLVHHVGPNRVYVTLARRLAAAGLVSLRFDFAGIGDSPARRDDLNLEAAVLRDAANAMDFLARTRGAKQFVLLGLCLGAHNAFRIACRDPRIVGLVMIDGYAYRTIGYHVRRTLQRMRRARSWRSLIEGLGEQLKGILWPAPQDRPDVIGDIAPEDFGRMPERNEALGDLRALLGRGTRCLFIFTERGMRDVYNHQRQFFETFPELRGHSGLAVTFMRGTDHTFTLLHHQDAMVEVVERWARDHKSVATSAPLIVPGSNGAARSPRETYG